MKIYHIYYLPNVIREYVDGTIIKGKIGYSSLDPELRKRINKNGSKKRKPLDVTNHIVLVNGIETIDAAKKIELRLQQLLRCCEPNVGFKGKTHSLQSKQKMNRTGSKHLDATKEKMRKSHLGKKRNKIAL